MPDSLHKGSVQYGTTRIDYVIRLANRRTLAIHVFPDGSVVTDVPRTVTEEEVASKIRSRGAWILKQQRLFATFPQAIPARQYVSGEEVRYLGRQYRLKVFVGDRRYVKLKGAYLEISLLPVDPPTTAKKLVDSWLKEKAEGIVFLLMESCVQRASALGIKKTPEWRLLRMQKRWGSCTRNGSILLNPELVAAPKDCIEYVILHELCHLRIPSHSSRFYRLLAKVVPQWEDLRLKLNKVVELRLEL